MVYTLIALFTAISWKSRSARDPVPHRWRRLWKCFCHIFIKYWKIF